MYSVFLVGLGLQTCTISYLHVHVRVPTCTYNYMYMYITASSKRTLLIGRKDVKLSSDKLKIILFAGTHVHMYMHFPVYSSASPFCCFSLFLWCGIKNATKPQNPFHLLMSITLFYQINYAIKTPLGPRKVSLLERCPFFRIQVFVNLGPSRCASIREVSGKKMCGLC